MKRKETPAPEITVLPPMERVEFPVRRDLAIRLRELATGLVVNSPMTLAAGNAFVLRVKAKYQECHAAYKKIVDPLEESKKNTKLLFDPVLTALAESERIGKEKVGTYLLAEKHRIEKEQGEAKEKADRAAKEAEDKRQKDADAAAAEAKKESTREAKAAGLTKEEVKEYAALEAEGARAKVLEAPLPIVQSATIAPVRKSFATEDGRMNAQFEYDYELQDVVALNAARPDLVEKTPRRRMILEVLKATNGAPIPGLRVVEKAKMTGTI